MPVIVTGTRYDYKTFRKATGEGNDIDPSLMKGTPADDDYLARNKDVADAVAKGEFVSGYDHWLQYGKSEYENNTPPDKRFGTPGWDAVKTKWSANRYYNLELNNRHINQTQNRWIKWVVLAGLVVGVYFIYKKFKK